MQRGGLLRYLLLAAATSFVITAAFALFDKAGDARREAYLAVETFTPWNLATTYADIWTFWYRSETDFPSSRPLELVAAYRATSKELTSNFSLTRNAPFFAVPITSVIDLVVHALTDSGYIGFLFTLLQIAIGAAITFYLGGTEGHGFYYYTLAFPVLTVAAATVAAIPLWAIAFVSVLAFNSTIGLGVHTGITTFAVSWIGHRVAEKSVHDKLEQVMDQVVGSSDDVMGQ